jgi:hypothetical protein
MNIDLSVFFLKVTGGVTFFLKVTGVVTLALNFLLKTVKKCTTLLLSHFLALPTIIFRFSVYFFYRYVFCPNATSRID